MADHRLMRGVLAACLVAGLSALPGCADRPPIRHLLLSSPQTTDSASSQWEVRRVKMPEYLDSFDVEMRTDDYVLTRVPDVKWAERLSVGTTRLLQQAIDARVGKARDRPYMVNVSMDSFEPTAAGEVVLSARWKVTDRRSDTTVAQDIVHIRQPLASPRERPSAIGRAMSRAVGQLAQRIVAGTR